MRNTPGGVPGWYLTVPGDTLPKLSKRFYGTPKYGLVIWQANRDTIADYNHLNPGIHVFIPRNLDRCA